MKFIPYNSNLKKYARKNRHDMPEPERRLWFGMLAQKSFLGLKFTKQKPIDNFILDFYCSKLLLAIELDGDSHAEQEEYDVYRTRILEELGIRVVRIYNVDVMENLEGVWIYLEEIVQKRAKELGITLTPQPPFQGE